jgi:hypothetical protein
VWFSNILSSCFSHFFSKNTNSKVRRICARAQRYVELYEELYENRPRETICEIALNVEESKRLMEKGFKYETGEYNDGGKLFYKLR